MVVRKYDRVDVQLEGIMRTGKSHSEELKTDVLRLFEETDMSARDIAKAMNKKYKYSLHQKLTRLSCLGIKFRAGKCKPREVKHTAYVRSFPLGNERIMFNNHPSGEYIRSLAYNELEDKLPEEERKERLITALKG